jgi:hypothetical protein
MRNQETIIMTVYQKGVAAMRPTLIMVARYIVALAILVCILIIYILAILADPLNDDPFVGVEPASTAPAPSARTF